MNSNRPAHTIDFLFIISLLFLFVFSAIMMIALGADCYQHVIDTMDDNSDMRTSCAYVVEKIHQSDSNGNIAIGCISIGNIANGNISNGNISNGNISNGGISDKSDTAVDSIPAVIMEQTINNETYCTYLYEYNDHLTELLTSSDNGLDASAGQQLIPIDSFSIAQEGNLYKINIISADNQNFSIYVHNEECTTDFQNNQTEN